MTLGIQLVQLYTPSHVSATTPSVVGPFDCDSYDLFSIPMSTMNISISEDHVGLVLLSDHDGDSSFYLEIPLDSINANCLDAARYLLFVGWCILGVEGVLSLEPDGQERDSDDDIVEQEIYYYVRHEGVFCG